jgi:hypothetical protein
VISAPKGDQAAGQVRPTITFSASDPDGEAIGFWSVAVYRDNGSGAPDGAVVYQRNDNSAASGGWTPTGKTITHVPAEDLPTGDLLVRARIATGTGTPDVRSVWSSYQPFTLTGDRAGITFVAPAAEYQYLDVPTMADPATSIATQSVRVAFRVIPPSVGTLSRVTVKLTVEGQTTPAAELTPALTADGTYDLLIPLTTTAVNGKVLDLVIETETSVGTLWSRTRKCRLSYARVSLNGILLGPGARNLRSSYTVPAGSKSKHYASYRAQSTSTGGALSPGYASEITSQQPYIPAGGCYLGIMLRVVRLDDDDAQLSGFDRLTVSWEQLG